MGTEEKIVVEKSLMEVVRDTKLEVEKEIQEVLYRLHAKHKFIVSDIQISYIRLTSMYENNPAPCYEIKIKLDI